MISKFVSSVLAFSFAVIASHAAVPTVTTAGSGPWSQPATWKEGRVPGPGDSVQIQSGHHVIYDAASKDVMRAVYVGGTLTFTRDKDTLLCAGLIRIAPGNECKEEGFDCHAHPSAVESVGAAALEVGTPAAPIPAEHRAIIRLTYVEGMDKQSFPALVCCGGRMDIHGAPLNRTWVKLGDTAYPQARGVELETPVTGWKVGDHLLLPTTESSEFYQQDKTGRRIIGSILHDTQTEEAEIAGISPAGILLKNPLRFKHQAEGQFRGEIANLSRNVIVESADPEGVRGHTMYHRQSAGSISYAEFRHLGKEGVLGRYPIHFHQCGDSMRGSSVVGASIWDSRNRWLTIHGTDYLVVRDCVGYRSIGHGYFFEDGSEVFNILDGNLAVQALMGKPLPQQMLPFDTNDAAGFWWANCLNSFTHNVAVECEKHGYRFQMTKTADFDPRLLVRQADGTTRKVDVRTLPFLRFEGNEAHSQRRFALNLGGFHGQSTTEDLDRDGNVIDRVAYLGGDVQGVGPDERHPFRIKDFLVWRSHWAFHTTAPNVVIDGFHAYDINYVVWRSNVAGHNYNHLDFREIHVSTFFNNWGAGNSRSDLLRYADPEDTMPPVTVITGVKWEGSDRLAVSGVSADDGTVREVRVNGNVAVLQPGSLTRWTASFPALGAQVDLAAGAIDEAGNRETNLHRMHVVREKSATSPVEAKTAHAMESNTAPVKDEQVRESVVNTDLLSWPLWDGRETSAEYARRTGLAPERTITLNGEKLDLLLIPAGSFLMGSPAGETGRSADEGPQHRVVISRPFYLGKYEVTQVQYEKVAGANPSYFKGPNRPVEQVNWQDAESFLQKAGEGLRLPTEAEWEFACRAGQATPFASAEGEEAAVREGWYGYSDESARAHSEGASHPVGGKAPNAFGIHDLHGNVYEWCADWYAPEYYRESPALDPAGPANGDERVLRGGSWEAGFISARAANRNGFSPNSRGYVVGFRVVLPVPAPR